MKRDQMLTAALSPFMFWIYDTSLYSVSTKPTVLILITVQLKYFNKINTYILLMCVMRISPQVYNYPDVHLKK